MDIKKTLPLKYWGLERWPFPSAPDAARFYPTRGHNEALARIDYLVDARRRVGVVLGESGVGKSLILQVAAWQMARQGRAVVLVDTLGLTTRELLWQVASGLGTGPRADADGPRLWRQIADRVVENRMQQVDTVLLVDEAGQAGPDVMTQLVRLARLDPSPGARWTIALAAEPQQAARWNETLRDLIDLRVDLSAWEMDETVGFVQMALVEAGREEPLFDDAALAMLHELTGGVPRCVARLADFALLAGAAAGLDTIDAATVDAANDEVAWPEPAGAY